MNHIPFTIATTCLSVGSLALAWQFYREFKPKEPTVRVLFKKYMYHRDKSKLLDRYVRGHITAEILHERYDKIYQKFQGTYDYISED
jgi:hypothetical protein